MAEREARVLFIGGPADGEWRQVALDRGDQRIPIYPRPAVALAEVEPAPTVRIMYPTYKRHCLRCDETFWVYYVVEGMTPEVALTRLFQYYRPLQRAAEVHGEGT